MGWSVRSLTTNAAAAISAAVVVFLAMNTAYAEQAKPKEHVIEIRNFKFSPARITVRPGDKVTWVNRDIVPHTATADDKSWDTGTLSSKRPRSVLMTGDIRAAYYCRFHPKMTAELEITVQ